MIWDWQVFLAGVGLGAMIYCPLGMVFMYWIIMNELKKNGYHYNKLVKR